MLKAQNNNMIKISEVKSDRIPKTMQKSIHLNLKLTPNGSAFLKVNKVSPQALLDKAMLEIGFIPDKETEVKK